MSPTPASAKDAGMPQRVAAGLRPDAEAMRSRPDGDPCAQAAGAGVDGVDLGAIAAGQPQDLAISRYTPHVGRAVRDVPSGDDPLCSEAQHGDGAGGTI